MNSQLGTTRENSSRIRSGSGEVDDGVIGAGTSRAGMLPPNRFRERADADGGHNPTAASIAASSHWPQARLSTLASLRAPIRSGEPGG